MIGNYLIGILGIIGLMILWVIVQRWWGRAFAEEVSDDDVLADRRSCGDCGCTTVCKTKKVVKPH